MSLEIGRVLKKGKIRVDARKAITKLRDHLLVDLHLYAVELVRAAVLAGASRVDVTFDVDDVIIAFDGRALDPAELPRLFEHLTADAEGDEDRSPRTNGPLKRRVAPGARADRLAAVAAASCQR